MTSFLKLVYSREPAISGLPIVGPMIPVDQISDDCKTVTYRLKEDPFIQKFLTLFFETKSKVIENMQYYTLQNYDNIKQLLYSHMHDINAIKPVFDTVLFSENLSKEQLNDIHLCFEKAAYKCQDLDLADMLKNVNFLVHSLERSVASQIEMGFMQITTALRHNELGIPLTSYDYSRFEIPMPGQLFIDNNILGKNLFMAVDSQDFSLIKNGLTRQQTHVLPAFQITYHSFERKVRNFQYWLRMNKENLPKYYDLDDPSYALGNIILGSPIDTDLNTPEGWFNKIFDTHKKLVCCYATDQNNNITHCF